MHERQRQGYLELLQGVYTCEMGGGSIVNVASLAATYGLLFVHYTTSKAAVIGLTRGLARELGLDKCIAPTAVITEGTAEFFGDKMDGAMDVIKNDRA